MTATVLALLVTGHGARRLSLHTRRDRALAQLAEVARELWVERFGYSPPEWPLVSLPERLAAEGWQVTLDEVEVDLA